MEALAIMCDNDYNLLLWCSSNEAPDMRFYAWIKRLGPLCRASDATLEGAILKLYGIYEQEMKKATNWEKCLPQELSAAKMPADDDEQWRDAQV